MVDAASLVSRFIGLHFKALPGGSTLQCTMTHDLCASSSFFVLTRFTVGERLQRLSSSSSSQSCVENAVDTSCYVPRGFQQSLSARTAPEKSQVKWIGCFGSQ